MSFKQRFISDPSEIDQVGVTFQNDSITVVQWVRPKYPRGNINIYEVNFKKRLQHDNDTVITNTTGKHAFFCNYMLVIIIDIVTTFS